ncbi:MAG: type II CAAX prenyl endopeptidase Rce1 family protein [Eggerthellaceae bacterium]
MRHPRVGAEVFCRGYVLTSFSARYSVAVGMAVQTVVFALFHVLIVGRAYSPSSMAY